MFFPTSLPQPAARLILGILAVVGLSAALVLSPPLAAQVGTEMASAAAWDTTSRDIQPLHAELRPTTADRDPGPPALPKGSFAAACMDCGDDDEYHWATWAWLPMSGWGPGDGSHLFQLRSGVCLFVHGVCVYVGSQTTPREVTDAVAEAIARRDVATLASLLETPHAAVFADRDAIQILGCDGTTIAGHVPVERGLLSSVQAAVAVIDTDR